MGFNKYERTNIAEMRQVTELDIYRFHKYAEEVNGAMPQILIGNSMVSISQADRDNGSPKCGDMIARNPKNHGVLWLVAFDYFKENFRVARE